MTTPRVFPDPFPPACATAWGDDRYGLWCEITVKGVVQRLRWIEPGAFWMGSTEHERATSGAQGDVVDDMYIERNKNEAPRHCVVLTQGFWLADATCTQELWTAVVGDSPSHFKGEQDLPVDSVSWGDITTKFLRALNQQLTEADVILPTEAQWEYACRAGTKTAYHFGEMITKGQVNFDGRCSLPVKALLANPWGLYQMHGNIWEWCADARRSYAEEGVTDPEGGQDSGFSALRGGSWYHGAGLARSAFRFDHHRSLRSQDVGFRFSLRSIKPGRKGAGVR